MASREVPAIPSFGFARGAVVRHRENDNHMIVVRGLGERTVCVFCAGDAGGQLRMLEFKTCDLIQELPSGVPATVAS